MTSTDKSSRILQALEALKALDRRTAAALLGDEIEHGPASGNLWKSVAKLASTIGEIETSIEASRRYAVTEPVTLERLLHYWGELASFGRTDEALAGIERLPVDVRAHEGVLHFLGTTAAEKGNFALAETYYRRAIARSPLVPQTWFALAMIKTFAPGDPDLEQMERYRPTFAGAEPSLYARFLYALAKARHDCGDHDRAVELYAEGAALRKRESKFDWERLDRSAGALTRDFTPEAFRALRPSGETATRALFVNGLPRSGTTLVEQMLASHSAVTDGAEVNLLRAALIPTKDHSFAGGLAYQERARGSGDPWGELARDYHRMIAMRFGAEGLIVDKTLSQSHFMGLLLHILPSAKVVWLRRDPADAALSCYRSFFTSSIPWAWSFEDIGRYFRIEDRLHRHWTTHFPDRILTVPYEALARDPAGWIPRILAHLGLSEEPQVHEFHRTKRSVRTASVQQVRAPISTSRIGAARAYHKHMEAFRRAYEA